MQIVTLICMIIYLIFGYWATGKTIYANKIIVYQQGQLFLQKLIMGGLLGWILIPWAILKMIFSR